MRERAVRSSLHFSPPGEAKCVRGPSGRGASRLARAAGQEAAHESRPFFVCFDTKPLGAKAFPKHALNASCLGATAVPRLLGLVGHESRDTNHESRPFFAVPSTCRLAARVKSPVEGAAGSCGRSARSEEDGDPGDLLRRTTKPTAANVRRPKGYAPHPVNGTECAAPCSSNDQALLYRPPARNAARVTFDTG